MDNKPDSNEKKIDDLNFSVVDNVCMVDFMNGKNLIPSFFSLVKRHST